MATFKREYELDQDHFKRYFQERLVIDESAQKVPLSEIWDNYRIFCDTEGIKENDRLTNRGLAKKLREKNIEVRRADQGIATVFRVRDKRFEDDRFGRWSN